VSEAAQKKTALYNEHVRLGGKMVPFAGWLMPVQYTSIVEEHQAVRNNAGVFDISHMGQFIVEGAGAGDWLNSMLTNNIGKLEVGTGQYTFLLNERAGVIDDLIVYRVEERKFLLVVNAARADEDLGWLRDHLTEGISLTSRSANFGAVAIQGPHTVSLFHALFGERSTFRHGIGSLMFHSALQTSPLRAPATPGRMVSKSSSPRMMR
jgi:aminomethyltransferase